MFLARNSDTLWEQADPTVIIVATSKDQVYIIIIILSLQGRQFLDLLDHGVTLEVDCRVIDLIRGGLCLDLLECDLPDVVGLLIGEGFDQLRTLCVLFRRANVFANAPTAIADVPCSAGADGVVPDLVGELAIVRVVLHRCDEGKLIEERSPKRKTLVNHQSIVGSFVGIGASWVNRVVIVGEVVKLRVIGAVVADEGGLVVEVFDVARIQVEHERWADLVIVEGTARVQLRNVGLCIRGGVLRVEVEEQWDVLICS